MTRPDASPLDDYDLEEALPYLLNRAGAHMTEVFSDDIRQLGITLSAWRVIASLFHREDQTLSELALHTSIDLSTLSRQVAALEGDKVLKRLENGDDKRSLKIQLTAKGRKLASQAVPLAIAQERTALAGFSPADVATLKRLLIQVYNNLPTLPRRSRRST